MHNVVKTEDFRAAKRVRAPKTMQIAVDGGMVSITVGLQDAEGNYLTTVDISPDDSSRAPGVDGRVWTIHPDDGSGAVRLVRQPERSPEVLVYHRTTPEAAQEILTTGIWKSEELLGGRPVVFLSNRPNGYASGHGDALMELVLPDSILRIDDEYEDGEEHYWVNPDDIPAGATNGLHTLDFIVDGEPYKLTAWVSGMRVAVPEWPVLWQADSLIVSHALTRKIAAVATSSMDTLLWTTTNGQTVKIRSILGTKRDDLMADLAELLAKASLPGK